jgi:hypothetical protein
MFAALEHMPAPTAIVRTGPYIIAEVNHALPPQEVLRQAEEGDRQLASPQHFLVLLSAILEQKAGDYHLFWNSAKTGALWELVVTHRVVAIGPARRQRIWRGSNTLFMPLAA